LAVTGPGLSNWWISEQTKWRQPKGSDRITGINNTKEYMAQCPALSTAQ